MPIDKPDVADLLHNFQHRLSHLLAFGLLGLLGRWAFGGWPRAALLAVLVTSLFGITDELHQSFVPGRRAAIDDWALDTASAALAIYVFARLQRTRVHAFVQTVAPLAVAVAFAAGLALAVQPALSLALARLSFTGT